MRAQSRFKPRRGLVLMDAMAAVMILGILLAALAGTMTYEKRALLRLADRRAATRLAEQTLLALQTGGPNPALADGSVAHTTLATPAPAGYIWLDVFASVGTSQIHLTGLVPAHGGGEP